MKRYRRQPLDWKTRDCVRMARQHLKSMGHKVPALPRYASARGALGALRRAGYADLEAVFDAQLPRIAPAEMLPGDIGLVEGEGPLDAVLILVSTSKALGWHGDHDETVIMTPHQWKAAWRA